MRYSNSRDAVGLGDCGPGPGIVTPLPGTLADAPAGKQVVLRLADRGIARRC